jgi:hypothetical protein
MQPPHFNLLLLAMRRIDRRTDGSFHAGTAHAVTRGR